jgi:hypothetical protein
MECEPKKVINGKVYNTETATRVASYDNGLSHRDFGFCEEDLYKTKKGAWFLHGEGGAMSRWSRPVESNGRCGGSGIEVLTQAEALAWCEEHGVDADVIAEHFQVEEA